MFPGGKVKDQWHGLGIHSIRDHSKSEAAIRGVIKGRPGLQIYQKRDACTVVFK